MKLEQFEHSVPSVESFSFVGRLILPAAILSGLFTLLLITLIPDPIVGLGSKTHDWLIQELSNDTSLSPTENLERVQKWSERPKNTLIMTSFVFSFGGVLALLISGHSIIFSKRISTIYEKIISSFIGFILAIACFFFLSHEIFHVAEHEILKESRMSSQSATKITDGVPWNFINGEH